MKNYQNPFFILISLVFALTVSTRAQDINPIEIRIDPRKAMAEELSVSEVFSKINYIPLETTKNCIIGQIDQMEISDEYFIILNKRSKIINNKWSSTLGIFDKSGKLHAKIDDVQIPFFSIDPDNKMIITFDYSKEESLIYYDFNGKFIKKIARPFNFMDFTPLRAGSFAMYKNFDSSSSDDMSLTPSHKFNNLIVTNSNFKSQSAYLPFDTLSVHYTEVYQIGKNFLRSGENIYFVQPYQFKVRKMLKDSLINCYDFIFPLQNTLPVDFLNNLLYKSKRFDYLNQHPYAIFSINNFFSSGSSIAFTLNSQKFKETFLFNLKSRLLTSLSSIIADEASFGLPIGSQVIASDAKHFFGWIDAKTLIQNKKKITLLNNNTEPENSLSELIRNGDVRANPVLIEFSD